MKLRQLFFTASLLFASYMSLGAMEGSIDHDSSGVNESPFVLDGPAMVDSVPYLCGRSITTLWTKKGLVYLSGVDESPDGLYGPVVVASMPYQDDLSILAVVTNKGLIYLFFWDNEAQAKAICARGKGLVIDVLQGENLEITRLEFDQKHKTIRVFVSAGEQHDLTGCKIHCLVDLRDYVEFDEFDIERNKAIIPSEKKIIKGDGGQDFCVVVNQHRTVVVMGMLREGVLWESLLLSTKDFHHYNPRGVITAIDAVAYRDGKYLIALAHTQMNVEFFTFDPRTRKAHGLGRLEITCSVPRIGRLAFNIEKHKIRIMFSGGQWREEALDFILPKDSDSTEAIDALSDELGGLTTDDADSGESADHGS